MRLEHVAVWTRRLEALRAFYETYFGARAGARYENPRRGFCSYFLAFGDRGGDGARLELMSLPELREGAEAPATGYAHLAMAVGTEGEVDALTARLRQDGHRVLDGPRRTGDGYYESVVLDPDGNRVEITAG